MNPKVFLPNVVGMMGIRLMAALLVAILSQNLAAAADFSPWLRKMQIAFPGYQKNETLSSFPVMVNLGPSIPSFSYNQFLSSSGADLRFTAEDGTSELPYEVEAWNTNGNTIVWVQVPGLSRGTIIWAYWGMTNCTIPSYAVNGSVWASGHSLVYHMSDKSGTKVTDSTSIKRDGTFSVSPVWQQAGVVGAAVQLKADERLSLASKVTMPDAWCASLWFSNIRSTTQNRTLFSSSQSPAQSIILSGAQGLLGILEGSKFLSSGYSFLPAPSGWHNLTAVGDAGASRKTTFYLDGKQVGFVTNELVRPLDAIGNYISGSQRFSDYLDEVRISSVSRSADWVWASWANVISNSSFCSYEVFKGIRITGVKVIEGDAGLAQAVFRVWMRQAESTDVSVDYATSNGTAQAGTDYYSASGSVLIPAGQTEASVNIQVRGDVLYEGESENFYVVLKNPLKVPILSGVGDCVIQDDDPVPQMWVDDVSMLEGNGGQKVANFKINLSKPSGLDVSADYVAVDVTATSGSDYDFAFGKLKIPAGQSSVTIPVNIFGDLNDEEDVEIFSLRLSSPVNAVMSHDAGDGYILDDDPVPYLAAKNLVVTEGDGASELSMFELELSQMSGRDVIVKYSTSDGTAREGEDYHGNSGEARIAAGFQSVLVPVEIYGDRMDEGDSENFFLNLSAPSNAVLSAAQAEATIRDDDLSALAVGDISVREGDSASDAVTTNAVFAVTLGDPCSTDVTFRYATSNGTALAGIDYTAVGGMLTLTSGQTAVNITVPVKGNLAEQEVSRAFFLRLSDSVNAPIADGVGVATIYDDDGPTPSVSVRDVRVTEGTGIATSAVFVVSLSRPTGYDVVLDVGTSNGTAEAGTDYASLNGQFTISPPLTNLAIPVSIVADAADEMDEEVFYVRVKSAANATIADGLAVGTVVDDDPVPLISIDDIVVSEGDAGVTNGFFTVSLSAASGLDVGVDYATSNGTALSAADYVASTGRITITAGTLQKSIPVSVIGDLLNEPDLENYFVNLSNPANGRLGRRRGQCTIADNEITPFMWISSVSVIEGDSGTRDAVMTVNLSDRSVDPISVNYATSNGTALAGLDYTAATGVVRIAAGNLSATIVVKVNGDAIDEGDSEKFYVNLRNVSNAILSGSRGQCTIIDDDAPMISIRNASLTEGDTGQTNMTFALTLSAVGVLDVLVDYATSNGTAQAGSDYQEARSVVRVPAGQTNVTIAIPVFGDRIDEGASENVYVHLLAATNGTILVNRAEGTIIDNDPPPLISVTGDTVQEGDVGKTNLRVTVSLSMPSGLAVSGTIFSSNVTATAGVDYGGTNRYFTIPAGQTNLSFALPVPGDTLYEGISEIFHVRLRDVANATLGLSSVGVFTIVDDDVKPGLSVRNASAINEGDTVNQRCKFIVTLEKAAGIEVKVGYATSNGTAMAGSDYMATNGTLRIPEGSVTGNIFVVGIADKRFETADEIFFVNLTNAVYATVGVARAECLILDDDLPPEVSVREGSVLEGNQGSRPLVFTVALSSESGVDTTVEYRTLAGTARPGLDFVSTNGSVVISAGHITAPVPIQVLGDLIDEGDSEKFSLQIYNPDNASIGTSNRADGIILDDDEWPLIAFGSPPPVKEGDAGETTVVLPFTLSYPPIGDATLYYTTSNGSAQAGLDYALTTGVLTIPGGQTNGALTLRVFGDRIYEGGLENFSLVITNAFNARPPGPGGGLGVVWILDDDPTPNVFVGDLSVQEGDVSHPAEVAVYLDRPSIFNVLADLVTSNGTALAGGDYVAAINTVTIPAGQTNGIFVVQIVGERKFEGSVAETFHVFITNALEAGMGRTHAVVSIQNDDPAPTVFGGTGSILEGNSGVVSGQLSIYLSAASILDVEADYVTSNGTATAGVDYPPVNNGRVRIPAGQTNATVQVQAIGDVLSEGSSELYYVVLRNPVNASAGVPGQVRILDDDVPPGLRINDVTVQETDTGSTNATFTVSLTGAIGADVRMSYITSNGTALAFEDFVRTNGTLVIPAGQTSATFRVSVLGDKAYEGVSERFFLVLTGVTNATVLDHVGQCSIVENDTPPLLRMDDVTVQEGNTGTTNAVFHLRLAPAVGVRVSARYEVAGGTTTAGRDYVATNGVVTFPPGATNASVTVVVKRDLLDEGDSEVFYLQLSNPSNTVLERTQAACMILDDDEPPTLTVQSVTVTEGNSGLTNMLFKVLLSAPSGREIVLNYQTSAGTATPEDDYLETVGVLRIPVEAPFGAVDVQVLGDRVDEADEESLFLSVSNVQHAVVTVDRAQGTILDDDIPALTAVGLAVREGHQGTTNAVFTVQLSDPGASPITVQYHTVDGTAIAGADYVATNGYLRFLPGQLSTTVVVTVRGDRVYEGVGEDFSLILSQPTNAVLGVASAKAVIQDDDTIPYLWVSDAAILEGNEGVNTTLQFTVALSVMAGTPIYVSYSTSAGTARDGQLFDYLGVSGVLEIPPGRMNASIPVTVIGDRVDEGDFENFYLNLSNVVNAIILDPVGIGRIVDDDVTPLLSANNIMVKEGDAESVTVAFTVTLSGETRNDIQVDYTTVDGTAKAGQDYRAAHGTLSIPAGTTEAQIEVDVFGDLLDEGDYEAFSLAFTNGVNVKVAGRQGTCTISDDDVSYLSVADCAVEEGDEGLTNAVFAVFLSNPSHQDVWVSYATSNGVAQAGSDFIATNGVLRIAAGTTTVPIPVTVYGDLLREGTSEGFYLWLRSSSNASLLDAQAECTILDDDDTPLLSVKDVSVLEGDSGVSFATFNVQVVPVSGVDVTVGYATSNGTAVAGADYVATNGVLVITAGSTSATVRVQISGDTLYEGGVEKFFILLGNATNAVIVSGGKAVASIVEYDPPPQVWIGDCVIPEGDQGVTNAVFPLFLSVAAGLDIPVRFSTYDHTAKAGLDYVATNGYATIPAGTTRGGVTVAVIGDAQDEGSEEVFRLILDESPHAGISDAIANGTILDDDPAPLLSIGDATVLEGGDGVRTPMRFELRLSAPSAFDVTAQCSTLAGTATAGLDYVSTNTIISIPAGQVSASVVVHAIGDLLSEGDSEMFSVALRSVANATLVGDGTGRGIIIDDDRELPQIWVDDLTVVEPDSGTTSVVMNVQLSAPATADVFVTYETSNGTARAGSDYAATNGTLVILAGETNETLTLTVHARVTGDANVEQFSVRLLSVTGAVKAKDTANCLIVNNDIPFLTINEVTLTEGNNGVSMALFVINLSSPAVGEVRLWFDTLDGTAVAGLDYEAVSGPLVISPGGTSAYVPVMVIGDRMFEGESEQFTLKISQAVNAVILHDRADCTIMEDEPPPRIWINDVTVLEGNAASTNAVFTVTLSEASAVDVTVDYSSAAGTARRSVDFFPDSGKFTIPAGLLTYTITIEVLGDTLDEADQETFFVNLTKAVNAIFTDSQGRCSILDNDDVPFLSIAGVMQVEGTADLQYAVFPAWLSAPSGRDIVVNFGTSNGTAEAGTDYVFTQGQLSIVQGQTNGIITVPIVNDSVDEGDSEEFFVNLSSPVNTRLSVNQARGVIIDDDPTPFLWVEDVTVKETAPSTNAVFVVRMSAKSGRAVTVQFDTSDETANAGFDYRSTNGVLTLPVGSVSAVIPVSVLANAGAEPIRETFYLNLRNAVNASISDSRGECTIIDDVPLLRVSNGSVLEGNRGTTNLSFLVSLSTPAALPVEVDYATTNGVAVEGRDFVARTGTLTMPVGQTNASIQIQVLGDTLYEGTSESFALRVLNVRNAAFVGSKIEGTIQDDDTMPILWVADFAGVEGNAGMTNVHFEARLNVPSGKDVTARFATSNSTAMAGQDYVMTNGTLRIPAGRTNVVLSLRLKGDTLYEGSFEVLDVVLGDVAGALLPVAKGTGRILDDDRPPFLTVDNVMRMEGNSGTSSADFTLRLGTASGVSTVVDYATTNGTAVGGADYVASTGVVVIAAGATVGKVTVQVRGDTLDEGDFETFYLQLLRAANAEVVNSRAECMIIDDDAAVPFLWIEGVTLVEGDSGTTNAVFGVTLSSVYPEEIRVNYATAEGTARNNLDFIPANGVLNIPAGILSGRIEVAVKGDRLYEGPFERFFVNLTQPINAIIVGGSAEGRILDDDAQPTQITASFRSFSYDRTSQRSLVVWDTVAGWRYTVQTSTNLLRAADWVNVPDAAYVNFLATGSTVTYTNNPTTNRRYFYRIKAVSR